MVAIVQNGDPVLRGNAAPVPDEWFGTPKLAQMLRDMEAALDAEPDGVALAAPQIALPYRIFIVRYDRMLPPLESGQQRPVERGTYINPQIIKRSRKKSPVDEGCLSVRGIYGKAVRHEQATVRAKDAFGKTFERGGGGILAQAFQHEIDHLNGILFIDHAFDLHTLEARQDTRAPFVFFGTPYVARDTLEIMHELGVTPSLIVTSPDAPKGRGMQVQPTEVKVWAKEHDVPVITPEKFDAATIELIQGYEPAYGLAVAYGKLLPEKLIRSFPLGILNIHYSLLPQYRGASPVEAALLNGDTETGVTIQMMVKELDAGDILAAKRVAIEPTETTRELRARLIDIGANLFVDILPLFEAGKLEAVPQEGPVTHSGKIAKEAGELTLSGDARKNWNTYRAYAESPGTYFFAEKDGKKRRVKIKSAVFEGGRFIPMRVVPEGKKEMDYQDFLRGGATPR